jgi:probable HAF family extracellular repeat protein
MLATSTTWAQSAYTITPIGNFNPVNGVTGVSFATSAAAFSINENGQVVGKTAVPGGGTHGFYWDAASGMVDLGASLGGVNGASSTALKINNAGQVVGRVNFNTYHEQAFVWSKATGSQALPYVSPAYPGYPGGGQSLISNAAAINNAGIIVGDSEVYSADPFRHPRTAVTWNTNAGNAVTDLTTNVRTAVNYLSAYGKDINDNGQIVGRTSGNVGSSTQGWAGFLLTPDGNGGYTTREVPGVVQGRPVYAEALNNSGKVVGRTPYLAEYAPSVDDYYEGAFVFDPTTGQSSKLGKLGYRFSAARDINDSGVVVGSVFNYANESTPRNGGDVTSGCHLGHPERLHNHIQAQRPGRGQPRQLGR